MRFHIILIGILSCTICYAAEKQYTSLNKIALKLIENALNKDEQGCINLAINYEQLSSFVKNVKYSKEEYDKKVKQYTQKLIVDANQKNKVEVTKVNIVDVQILYPKKDSKIKRETVFVVLGYSMKVGEKEIKTPPFFFFAKVDKEWKWSIIK